MTRCIPLFLLALLASPALAEEDPKPPDCVHHALPQKKVGFYAVFLPPGYDAPENKDTRYPVCIILHGRGSNEVSHGSMSSMLGRKGVLYVAPRAAHAHEEAFIELKRPGWTAWPTYPDAWGEWGDPGFPKDELASCDPGRFHTDWIADCLADVRKRYRTTDEKAVVFGHSEGAAFAHRFALAHPEQVRAYFAYAGYYSDVLGKGNAAKALKDNGIVPVIAHSEGDPMVGVRESRDLIAYLEKEGVPHEKWILPGGGHGFGSKASRRAQEFIAHWCRHEALPPSKGVLVVAGVVADSTASRMGIREEDVILSCDGEPVKDIDAFKAALDRAASKEEAVFSIRRGEDELTLKAKVTGPLGVQLREE